MDNNTKEICVFMPFYNCEKYIERSIKSILEQSFQAFDVIVVDDGSTDGSFDIINSISESDSRIKIYRNERNMGLGYTRNLMFEYCKEYKYVALMDADDLAPVNRLKIEYSFLESHEDITCVSGLMQFIDENDNLGEISDDGMRSYEDLKKVLVFRDSIANGSVMMRMSDLIENNLQYRLHFFCAQDYMFYCELIQKCKMVKISEVLLYYREYVGNVTYKSYKKKKERDRLLDELHDYTFSCSGIKVNPIERWILKRGYRDTNDYNLIFEYIFSMCRIIFKIKNPEYRGYM